MMKNINWDEVLNEIEQETAEEFQDLGDFNIRDSLLLFRLVIEYSDASLPDSLNGIKTRIPNALHKFFLSGGRLNELTPNFVEIVKIEPFLKKLLFIVDPTEFSKLDYSNKGLAPYINKLRLNPNRIDYTSSSLSPKQQSQCAEHLLKSYKLRNIESHQCKEWTRRRIYSELCSVLTFMLYAVYKHKEALQNKFKVPVLEPTRFDREQYLEKVKNKFSIWSEKFVQTHGIENIHELAIYATELTNEENEEIAREGIIDQLREEISERRMLLTGEAGIGKSTTLQFLTYIDACKAEKIPVYLPLKLLTKEESLIYKISKELGVSETEARILLEKGEINLHLDGLNEVMEGLKQKTYIEIENIVESYPETYIILSSRPSEQNQRFCGVPSFSLQKMNENQIESFLDKNTQNEDSKKHLLNEIQLNPRLKKVINTPLMLYMLIKIYNKNEQMPEDESKIIEAFISNLLLREKREKDASFKDKYAYELLAYLGWKSVAYKGNTNAALSEEEILEFFSEKKEKEHWQIDLYYFLSRLVELNILSKDDSQYSFSHQVYLEFFAGVHFNHIKEKGAQQYIKRKAYAEIIRRAYGLLTPEGRLRKISSLSSYNLLLAARCKATSTLEENDLTEILKKKSINLCKDFDDYRSVTIGILSLLEIGDYQYVGRLISKFDIEKKAYVRVIRSYVETADPKNIISLLNIAIKENRDLCIRIINFCISFKVDFKRYLKELKSIALTLYPSIATCILIVNYDLNVDLSSSDIEDSFSRLKYKNGVLAILFARKYEYFNLKVFEKCINHFSQSALLPLITYYIECCKERNLNIDFDLIVKRLNEIKRPDIRKELVYLIYSERESEIDKIIELNLNSDEGVSFVKLGYDLMKEFQRESQFDINEVIYKLLKVNKLTCFTLALNIIQNEKLQSYFDVQDLIEKVISSQDSKEIRKVTPLIKKYYSNYTDRYKTLITELISGHYRLVKEVLGEYLNDSIDNIGKLKTGHKYYCIAENYYNGRYKLCFGQFSISSESERYSIPVRKLVEVRITNVLVDSHLVEVDDIKVLGRKSNQVKNKKKYIKGSKKKSQRKSDFQIKLEEALKNK